VNRLYPYNDPQVITDDLFVAYGGSTGSSTAFQRDVAYTMAEEWVSDWINTPIVPAIITGSYFYPQHGSTVQLDWAYLQRIHAVRFVDSKGTNYHTITGVANYDAAIRNKWRGVVDILTIYGNCQGCGTLYAPYEFEIVYEAGLPSGTYASKKMLWALTETSQMIMNEILGCGGNETPGLLGVTEFRNQEYSEKRMGLINTVFGSSPKAHLITKILGSVHKYMKVGL